MNNNELFNKWYYSLPVNEYIKKREKICQICNISKFTFYNWLSGKTKIPILAQKEIERTFEVTIFPENK